MDIRDIRDLLIAITGLISAIGVVWVKISQSNMGKVISGHGKKIDQQVIATAAITDQNAVIVDQNKIIVHQTNGAMKQMADLSVQLGRAKQKVDDAKEEALKVKDQKVDDAKEEALKDKDPKAIVTLHP